VPLCDNVNQGIVPTSASLGDGFSTTTNLYWATSHGQKKFFIRHSKWSQIVTVFTPNDTILERVAFERTFGNGARVLLVCDAYRGDQMVACLKDYFNFLAGYRKDSLISGNSSLPIGQDADMLVFNGHNGLMDTSVDTIYANNKREKDAVVIACSSESYFNPYFEKTNSYPLVNTTNLMYPGAFCMNGVIEKWAMMDTEENIRLAAGDAYNEIKKCGQRGARALFSTGWSNYQLPITNYQLPITNY
ncbi:hypothetical protein JYT74_03900, partial [Crocinitomix catalasitica]|nr:hypothetical protein [Crocinitomix catalasitica]